MGELIYHGQNNKGESIELLKESRTILWILLKEYGLEIS